MKRLLLIGCALSATFGFSQTTLYQEDFETTNSFTLNSSDLGASTTYNTWLVNNSFSGGSGTLVCMGFPFTFTVNNTPSQPAGITGAPSSNYLHISAQDAIANGITCASYIPADGTCVMAESHFSKMTTPISTVGYTNVTFDFWWMCAGSATGYGELYYSLDNGTTWTVKQSNMNNVTNWSQTAVNDAAWDNQANLQFAFRFVNNTGTNAADPSFCIDQLLVTGTSASNAITVDDVQPLTSWCEGDVVTTQVSFTATGSYNAGNVFTAELSDASGSFAASTAIGTLTSSTSGAQLISAAVIPGSIPAGTGYRIRVVASDPLTIGTDNGSDLVVHPLPTVTSSSYIDVCENEAAFTLTGGMPAGGTYSGTGVSGGSFDPATAGVGTSNITYTYADGNGCSNSATETITVLAAPTVDFTLPFNEICLNAGSYTFTEGTPAGGTYSGPGVTAGVFDPAIAGIGTWTVQYDYTATNTCSNSDVAVIQVTECLGLDENQKIDFTLYPNPVESSFTLISVENFESVSLKDVNGRVIQMIEANTQVDVSGLASGIYILEMKHNGQVYSERMMIK